MSVYRKIMGGYAGGLEAHDLQLLAEIILSVAAGIAFSAYHLRLNRDLLPDGKTFHPLSNLGDFTGNLMALGNRIFGEGMLPVIHMDIRTTDSDLLYFDQYLAGLYLGHRHLVKLDHARGGHNLLQHKRHSFLSKIFYKIISRSIISMYHIFPICQEKKEK